MSHSTNSISMFIGVMYSKRKKEVGKQVTTAFTGVKDLNTSSANVLGH